MARVAVIGESLRIYGYGLAGAVLRPVSDQAAAVRAWHELPDDVAVVVLTRSAADWLGGELGARPGTRPGVLPVVMPEPGAPDAERGTSEPEHGAPDTPVAVAG